MATKSIFIVFDRAGFIIAVFDDKQKMLQSDAVKDVNQDGANELTGPAADGCFWERHEVN